MADTDVWSAVVESPGRDGTMRRWSFGCCRPVVADTDVWSVVALVVESPGRNSTMR
jgi:hypothetical protein